MTTGWQAFVGTEYGKCKQSVANEGRITGLRKTFDVA